METITGREVGITLISRIGTPQSHSSQIAQTWHSHKGFELLFMLVGATAWEFRDCPPVEVTGGHVLIMPPGVEHRGVHGMRQPSDMCGLLVNPDRRGGRENTTFTRPDLRLIKDSLSKSARSVIPCSRELMSCVGRLVAAKQAFELDPSNPILKTNLRTLACSVIVETILGLQAVPATTPTIVVTAAEEFLQRHFRDQLRISDLVKHVGFSRSYLFATFKTVTGLTPNDYVMRLRIKRAQQLLAETEQSITAIALDSGFSSSQYFSSVFRKHAGQTPKDFRQKALAGS